MGRLSSHGPEKEKKKDPRVYIVFKFAVHSRQIYRFPKTIPPSDLGNRGIPKSNDFNITPGKLSSNPFKCKVY
ncbi:hypothetical protein CEXT_299801 [Caerostris extrusa]|uniref:Uncharacterized protein n=1 Tax=Caerostris extrusa TaxID=172846 RepID=A0AAV4V7V2_CAEEX|nr:hypothetical protein CEXT_299801 [Caerostris extrusa]